MDKPTFKVTLDFNAVPRFCRVQQDFGYSRAFRSGYSGGESWFYHAVAKDLRRQGFDVVKKLMYKDGHLVDDWQYYIRDRRGRWCIYDSRWQLRLAVEEFRRKGQVDLAVYGSPDQPLGIKPVFLNAYGGKARGYAEWKESQNVFWGIKP